MFKFFVQHVSQIMESLSLISFATDSEWTRIEAGAFAPTYLSLVIFPVSVLFITGDVFPADCTVALADHECVNV
jgi:hypothetical protein